MALDISQILAVSYPVVLAEAKKPENQWEESSALRLMEKMGAIKRVSLGESIEIPLDYRPNPDTAVMATDQDQAALLKTEVITSATYDIAQLSVALTWTKGDDAKNPGENQKVALVKALLENAISSHDDKIEQHIFTTSAQGGVELLGLDTLVPDSGAGSPGGINAAVETWWANFADTYTDATDIEAALVEARNSALKGSGSSKGPKFLLSGADPHAIFESVLTAQQRYQDVQEASKGFKTIMFSNLPWSFSQYGDDHIYLLNDTYKMVVSKQYFRDMGETTPVQGQNAFYRLVYTAMQNVISNKSRVAVLSQA